MANWWDRLSNERYWCEVTDRGDVGQDLKAPQTDESGHKYWSYSLIGQVVPGDVVFHYSTRDKAFSGASVAGGPMEQRPIVWSPHGIVGRAKKSARAERPGYWRPLYGYRSATPNLPLSKIEKSGEAAWIRNWTEAHGKAGPLRIPFQLRKDGLRAGQGYLFKMPADFVERWSELRNLADELDGCAEELSGRVLVEAHNGPAPNPLFQPKNEADYTAIISATVQHRTRTHEKLVRLAGEWLKARGFTVATPHPKDLEIISPVSVIIEAKVVGQRDPLFAAREALGQLYAYRYFIGPHTAALAVLLDSEPAPVLLRFIEDHLQVAVLWLLETTLSGGSLAKKLLLGAKRE